MHSPFNYEQNSKIVIIKDDFKGLSSLSSAILDLFKASKGGGLAIFTSIVRLRSVYDNINIPLLQSNIRLMGQHINSQKLVNIIDCFKEDINSCLLGTDSARDGIDVPGESLRMVIFEKVPWDKPDVLLKERLKVFGLEYRENLVRLKLRQSFGRLIRNQQDTGIFIVLDRATPTKLLNAFPSNISISRVSLQEGIQIIDEFFQK